MTTFLRRAAGRALIAAAAYVLLVTLLVQLSRVGLPSSAVRVLWIAASLALPLALFWSGFAPSRAQPRPEPKPSWVAVWAAVAVLGTLIIIYVGYWLSVSLYLLSGGRL